MCGDGKCYDARWGCVGKRDELPAAKVEARADCPAGQIKCGDGWCYDARYGCIGKREAATPAKAEARQE